MPPSPDPRISPLNDKETLRGDYVLCWMRQSQRAEHNPALDLAIREANRLRLSVAVGFGLTDAYPDVNYFLDGPDPNSHAGVAWVFGKHDRAWFERPVLGKVRYMAVGGLESKCDIQAYLRKVNRMVPSAG